MLLPASAPSRTARLDRLAAATVRVLPWAPYVVALGGFAVLAFLLLWHRGAWNIQDWDEARHIVSAVEMLRSGDWLVNTYMGVPDLWNLKPPVSFWAIAASIRVLGPTPFAMHLPSILATLGTAVVAWWFARRHAGAWAGAFAVLAIAGCSPLVGAHTGRTADPDAIYLLFLTIAMVAGVEALRRPRWLLVSTTAFSVAFLTKSWHSLLALGFIGVVAAVLLVRRRARVRDVLVAAAGFAPIVAWVVARYLADGLTFLVPMVQYDLLSRTGTPLEGHYERETFYIDQLQGSFGLWLVAGALGIGLHLAASKAVERRPEDVRRPETAMLALLAWIVVVLVAFTAASTKLYWYVAPVYPAAAILCGIGVALGVRALAQRRGLQAILIGVACLAFVVGAQNLKLAVSTTSDNATQLALVGLSQNAPGAHVYLDPSAGGWTQSLVAVAEATGLQPEQPGAGDVERGNAVLLVVGAPPSDAEGASVGVEVARVGDIAAFRLDD
jgi:4-amino-4-deoxy-L-arabinose transferase-like glycosyltransferase